MKSTGSGAPRLVTRTTLSSLLLALLVLGAASCASFDSTAKKIEYIGADAQIQAAAALNDAQTQTARAAKECGAAAKAAVPPVALPALSDASPVSDGMKAIEACRALGVEIPYNPVVLNKVVDPLNAFKKAVLALDSARIAAAKTGENDFSAALANAVDAAIKLYQALQEVGVKIKIPALDSFIAQKVG